MKDWPIYFKDRLIISNQQSSNAIISLWTPKDTIQKLVDEDKYYLLGQLYTKKGINYVLRNILANPTINKIYLVGSDLMDSGEAFVKFMKNGVDDTFFVLGDESAEIEVEISLEAIFAFRENVELVDLRGAENLKKLNTEITKSLKKDLFSWRDPELFPDPPKPQISSYPSELDLMKIRRATISEAYPSVLEHIMRFGVESEPVMNYASDTSNKMKELLNLSVVITDEDPNNPVLSDALPFNNSDLDNYYDGFFNFDRGTEDYTYGERLFNYASDEINELKQIYPWLNIDRFQKHFEYGGINQVSIAIIRKLKSFKYDKGAIAILGNPFSDTFPRRPSKKIPCLFLIQCQIYQNKLNLTAYFRSNDMYNAWALNAFALRKLQGNISNELGVGNGPLITISNMAHIYEHNYSDVQKLMDKVDTGFCEWDPRGNLVIEIEGSEIVARLISPSGNDELGEWRIDGTMPKAARDLSFILEEELTISTLGNALCVGRQLERANLAIRLGIEYTQDVSLDIDSINKGKTD